jgi:glutaredoxin
MNLQRKSTIYLIVIILVIGGIIWGIVSLNSGIDVDKDIVECIAENAVLYTSKTCSHCAQQKIIFGDYYDLITKIECTEDAIQCLEVRGVPAWRINEEFKYGVHTIEELQELTDC